MQNRWNNLVICDYEFDFDYALPFELDLYSIGVNKLPSIFFNSPQKLGKIRRSGIVDIPEKEYDYFVAKIEESSTNLDYVVWLENRFKEIIIKVQTNTENFETNISGQLSRITIENYYSSVTDLMSFHVLNWMLPFNEFRSHFESILGEELGQICALGLLTPSSPAHMLDFHGFILNTAQKLLEGNLDQTQVENVSRQIGHLQSVGLKKKDLENPHSLLEHVSDFATVTGNDGIFEQIEKMKSDSRKAEIKHLSAYNLALLKSRSERNLFEKSQAIARICRLATDEEELRRVFQLRALRNFRELAERSSLSLDKLSFENLVKSSTN